MAYKDKEREKEYQREYYLKNKNKLLIQNKKYYLENKEKILKCNKNYYLENKDKIKVKRVGYHKEYYKNNLEKIEKYRLEHKEKNKRNQKSGSAIRDLGCSIDELKFYIEGQFQQGMTWDNWGVIGTGKKWNIDHKIPLAFFDLTDRKQFLVACHYTNLQPLWALENIRKSNKILI